MHFVGTIKQCILKSDLRQTFCMQWAGILKIKIEVEAVCVADEYPEFLLTSTSVCEFSM